MPDNVAVPIELHAVTKCYGDNLVVDRVDLEIRPGEFFFLLGPSGCGKTTLLRMIAGLIEPTAGRILFGTRNVTKLPTQRRNTAMVFQGYALWPHMTVAQNVAFGLDVRKVSAADKAARVAQALKATHIAEFAQRKPAELSGGQQQRVALARALVVNPDVLLLDEPLSNLDAKLRLTMRLEIKRICAGANITAVYVTHDQEEALSMADRIAVMHGGRVSQLGTPKELYDRPANRFVADFLGQANFIDATVRERRGGEMVLDGPAGVVRSRVFTEAASNGAAAACCVRPEAARLLVDGESADNVLTGSRLETVYLGFAAQHVVRIGGSLTMRVHEQKPRRIGAVGETVRVGFDADDVVVLCDRTP